jgi:hypothetical protein
MSKQLTVIGMLVVVAFVGCGSSKKQQATQKQEASIAELKRVQAAFGDLQIAINADMSKQEFSTLCENALEKIGDLQHSEELAESGFPTEKNQVAEIYVRFNYMAQIYSVSAPFVGPDLETDTTYGVGMLNDSEQETIKGMQSRFPDFAKLTFHTRSEAAQGLWKLAGDTAEATGGLIDQLLTSVR